MLFWNTRLDVNALHELIAIQDFFDMLAFLPIRFSIWLAFTTYLGAYHTTKHYCHHHTYL